MKQSQKLFLVGAVGVAYYLSDKKEVPTIETIKDSIVTTSKKILEGMTMPRGIRNNNPLNIEKNSTNWQGKIEGNDSRFATFSQPEYGIRAGAKILLNYQKLYNLDTIEKIFNRYAPPFENDTNAYAVHMADALGIGTTETIKLNEDNLYPLITAMIKHENGVQPYNSTTIKNGIGLLYA